jgi:hypothetical protein
MIGIKIDKEIQILEYTDAFEVSAFESQVLEENKVVVEDTETLSKKTRNLDLMILYLGKISSNFDGKNLEEITSIILSKFR